MLRLGHKFATPPHLKETMEDLLKTVYQNNSGRISGLSRQESNNWMKWFEKAKRMLKMTDEPKPSRLIMKISKGIHDIKNMDVVIKQADKNLGIVPIKGSIYRSLRDKHLKLPSFQRVSVFPHQDICRRLSNILKIENDTPGVLRLEWIQHARKATEPNNFYVIPKLHKPTLGTRPITAQHSYMLAPLSRRLAKVLQLKVDGIPEIARDSKSVMQQLVDLRIHEPCELVTYDVEQLYPSIDLKDAIRTLHEEEHVMRDNLSFWTKILELIMFNNFVKAGDKIFRQMRGTATGTQVAPPFANLYLYHKFKKILRNPRILFKSRYIDDGLLVTRMNTSAKAIISQLERCSGLKLTFSRSPYEAIYLDIVVFKGSNYWKHRKFDTKVFFKPTNKFLYLPANSNHPNAQKKGIVKGEAIRCLRNTSNRGQWLQALNLIFKGLMRRGYKPSIIKQQWKKVRFEDREKYIFFLTDHNRPKGDIVKTKFHPRLRSRWTSIVKRLPIQNVFVMKRLGKFNKKQEAIIEKWPPHLLFTDFTRIGRRLISAKDDGLGETNSSATNMDNTRKENT